MKFDVFEARLNELLDQRRSWESDPEVAQLIRDSAEHRALAAAYGAATDRQTLESIDRLPACRPPLDLASRVLAALQADTSQVRPSAESVVVAHASRERASWAPPSWLSALFAVAATLLVAFGLSLLVPEPGATGVQLGRAAAPALPVEDAAPRVDVTPGQLVDVPATAQSVDAQAPESAPAPEAVAQDGEPTIGALVTEARDKYADLARDTQQAVSEVAVLFPGFGMRSSAARSSANAAAQGSGAASGENPGDWAGNVGEGLEPLTRSAVGALDFILQALPAGGAEPRS